MAKTHSGQLILTKSDREAIAVLVNHVKKDIDFDWGGSYGGYNEDSKSEVREAEREVKKAENALEIIQFILDTSRTK